MGESERIPCSGCQGSGKCLKCHGTGNILQHMPAPITVMSGEVKGKGQSSRLCPKCGGSGMCPKCKATGKTG